MKTVVVGGGIAGLWTAWFLQKKGNEVTLLEKNKIASGCTWAAAGMLAPANELEFQEPEIKAAGLEGVRLYLELERELGDICLNKSGTLEIALDADDANYLRRLFEFQQQQGLKVEWLQGPAIREVEPFVSPKVPAAIHAPGDIQIEQRAFVLQFAEALRQRGVSLQENAEVEGWETSENGLKIKYNSGELACDAAVFCTGLGRLAQKELPYKIYPVRGEMLSVQAPAFEFLQKSVRIRSKTLGYGYVVPKPGRLLLGSTLEEQGNVAVNTAGGLHDILRRCYAAVPGIFELPVIETWAGLRPSTLSRQPVVDQEPGVPVFHVNGLFRHGILLAPALGRGIAELVMGEGRSDLMRTFVLSR